MRSFLDARAAFLDGPAGTWSILDRGTVEAILLAANEPDALVCMATGGRGASREAVLGSLAGGLFVLVVAFWSKRLPSRPIETSDPALVLHGAILALSSSHDCGGASGCRTRAEQPTRRSMI